MLTRDHFAVANLFVIQVARMPCEREIYPMSEKMATAIIRNNFNKTDRLSMHRENYLLLIVGAKFNTGLESSARFPKDSVPAERACSAVEFARQETPELWPPKSRDSFDLSYKTWGCMQERVYKKPIRDVAELIKLYQKITGFRFFETRCTYVVVYVTDRGDVCSN